MTDTLITITFISFMIAAISVLGFFWQWRLKRKYRRLWEMEKDSLKMPLLEDYAPMTDAWFRANKITTRPSSEKSIDGPRATDFYHDEAGMKPFHNDNEVLWWKDRRFTDPHRH